MNALPPGPTGRQGMGHGAGQARGVEEGVRQVSRPDMAPFGAAQYPG
ncbi:hypothetical protein FHS35_000712 [Streptomyces umbrinus]|nr:hypothetical protein [Streptomyces umbrinus]